NIEVLADAAAVASKAAAIIAAEARDAVVARGRFIMAVSGGHTPWQMLRALAGGKVPWEQGQRVPVDERAAPPRGPHPHPPPARRLVGAGVSPAPHTAHRPPGERLRRQARGKTLRPAPPGPPRPPAGAPPRPPGRGAGRTPGVAGPG